jgi:hypothetical protein
MAHPIGVSSFGPAGIDSGPEMLSTNLSHQEAKITSAATKLSGDGQRDKVLI